MNNYRFYIYTILSYCISIIFISLHQRMANKVTTEWFDLQVKHGNFLPNEKQKTLHQEQTQMREKHEEQNKLQNVLAQKNQQELEELQDDLDFQDDFTKQFYAQRMAELKNKAEKMKYGQVYEISRDEYIREVTNAPAEDFVVLHLYQNSNEFCNLINQHLPKIAVKYGQVKFIKIIADKCIDKFPDSSCPCFIIYKAGKPVSNVTNMDKVLKGKIENMDFFFSDHGISPL